MCPRCHGLKKTGEHSWNQEEVLTFLRNYFSSDHILNDYLQDETQTLIHQRNRLTATRMEKEAGRGAERRAREVLDNHPAEEPQEDEEQEEEEEEEEEPALEEQAGEPYPTGLERMEAAEAARVITRHRGRSHSCRSPNTNQKLWELNYGSPRKT